MAFPRKVPLEKRFLGIFTAYLDESGTHEESDVVAVAGFFSVADRWVKFSQEWQAVLDYYCLDYFHMTDFESSQGQFKEWDAQKHKDCLNKLLGIIKENVIGSVGWAVSRRSFDAILSKPARKICGDAYGLASIGCFRSLAQIVIKKDGQAEYVMESGAEGSGALLWIYREGRKDPEWRDNNRLLSLAFQDKRYFLPLQSADIMAYELYKQFLRQLGIEDRPKRYPLKQLGTTFHEWHYPDDDELRGIDDWLSRPR